eukprot:163447-Amphidinium_carterae.1
MVGVMKSKVGDVERVSTLRGSLRLRDADDDYIVDVNFWWSEPNKCVCMPSPLWKERCERCTGLPALGHGDVETSEMPARSASIEPNGFKTNAGGRIPVHV